TRRSSDLSACGAARALVLARDSRLIGADVRRGAAVRTGSRALLNRFNREVGPPGGLAQDGVRREIEADVDCHASDGRQPAQAGSHGVAQHEVTAAGFVAAEEVDWGAPEVSCVPEHRELE